MTLKEMFSGLFSGKKEDQAEKPEEKKLSGGKKTGGEKNASKRVLMVIAPEKFRDEEFFEPKEIFEKEGFDITVASVKKTTAVGALGGKQKTDAALSDLSADGFDGICISGGGGSRTYLWDNKDLHRLINEFNDAGKPVGAICISPVVLAKAGVLKGRKCTVFNDEEGIKIIEESGSEVNPEKSMVCDGKIVTANGPKASVQFGRKMASLIRA